MIKEVTLMKNIGVYQNFRWATDLEAFADFNVIYGWNYAGKTTLSRVFRSIQLNRLHKLDANAQFCVTNENGQSCDQNFVRSENIKVFNSDYVRENVRWDQGIVQSILILGEESIELERKKREEEEKIRNFQDQKARKVSERDAIKESIRTLKTNKAREIGTLLGIRPFDSRHLENYLDTNNEGSEVDNKILSNSDFEEQKRIALSTDKLREIRFVSNNQRLAGYQFSSLPEF